MPPSGLHPRSHISALTVDCSQIAGHMLYFPLYLRAIVSAFKIYSRKTSVDNDGKRLAVQLFEVFMKELLEGAEKRERS